jgi:hypothetical protein
MAAGGRAWGSSKEADWVDARVPVVGEGDNASRGRREPGTNESPRSIATNSPAHP